MARATHEVGSADGAARIVAITGAAGGIGRALCRYFGDRGDTVLAIDKNPAVADTADRLRRDGVVAGHAVVDLTDGPSVESEFARLQDEFGAVGVLINNAGFSKHPSLARTSPSDWQRDIDGNLNAAYRCVHAVIGGMTTAGRGAIVTVGSVNALGSLGDPAYSAAKAALVSMTKSLAMEYGRAGIRANIVLPGTVRTPVWDERIAQDPSVLETLTRWYPLGRIAEPVEVARAVEFLASDAASAITGSSLVVDCGLTAGNLVMARELTLEPF